MEECLTWEDVSQLMEDIKAMARGLLRRERHASLRTTALVLTALRRQRHADQDWGQVTWANRQYFFGAVYRAMGQALIDHARVRGRRRDFPVAPEDLHFDALRQTMARDPALVVALVEALAELRQQQPQWVEAIEHRFYGELTQEETARLMGVDERTIQRWWERARLILAERILAGMNAGLPGAGHP
jgi:DNA-directed RNA polymerase specialized sigma24 family protein